MLKKYLFLAAGTGLMMQALVMAVSGFTRFHWTDLAVTAGIIASGVIFFFSVSGDGFSRTATVKENVRSEGEARGKMEELMFFWNPFLTGSLVYTIVSFSFPYFY